jgi:SAM-dependent methyltransferase
LGNDKLNIGGGSVRLKGFINIDFVEYPGLEIVANLLDMSFIPDNSISHIHSNHFIEHLTQEQLLTQLREYCRILKPGGLVTIRCPNALGASYGFWFPVEPEGDREQFLKIGYPADEYFHDPAAGWYHHDLLGLIHYFYADLGSVDNQHFNIITPTKLRTAVESSGLTVLKMGNPEATNIVMVAKL